jgi:hypothetical protein
MIISRDDEQLVFGADGNRVGMLTAKQSGEEVGRAIGES